MNLGTFLTCLSVLAIALAGASPRQALANHSHVPQALAKDLHANWHKRPKGELVRVVRDATRRFRHAAYAEAAGYQLHFGCVSAPDEGAMGLHYVNMALVGDGVLDAAQPEIVIYEPLPNGRKRLIGADYLVLADAWHANNEGPPTLMGQLLHLFPSPNRFGLPAFYTLHVWAWKPNPHGTFVNWHPGVSCDDFDGQAH